MRRVVAFGAIAGPVLFTLAWLVLGAVSPGYRLWDFVIAPYSAVAQPISGLGLGVTAPYMNAAFVVSGLLLLAGVAGIVAALPRVDGRDRRICFALLALTPIGMMIDGLFTFETFLPHIGGYVMAIAGGVLGFAFLGRALRRSPSTRWVGGALLVASATTVVLAIVAQLTFDPAQAGRNVGIGGLTERILIVEILAPFVALGWRTVRRPAAARVSRDATLREVA